MRWCLRPPWRGASAGLLETVPGTTRVDAERILDLAEKMPDQIIVDARVRQDRWQSHIEGSKSLPDIDTTCQSLARIIPRKITPVLFYCNGTKCGRSAKSSRKALECGLSTFAGSGAVSRNG